MVSLRTDSTLKSCLKEKTHNVQHSIFYIIIYFTSASQCSSSSIVMSSIFFLQSQNSPKHRPQTFFFNNFKSTVSKHIVEQEEEGIMAKRVGGNQVLLGSTCCMNKVSFCQPTSVQQVTVTVNMQLIHTHKK